MSNKNEKIEDFENKTGIKELVLEEIPEIVSGGTTNYINDETNIDNEYQEDDLEDVAMYIQDEIPREVILDAIDTVVPTNSILGPSPQVKIKKIKKGWF